MQMSQFIEALQADLRELAEIGGEELVQATQRLAGAIKQSATLRLIDALTQIALDLSSQLPNGHVEIRLAGQDPQLVYVEEQPSEPGAGEDGPGARPRRPRGADHAAPAGVAQVVHRDGGGVRRRIRQRLARARVAACRV